VIELIQKNNTIKVNWLEELASLMSRSKTSTPELVNSLRDIIKNVKYVDANEPHSPEVATKKPEDLIITETSVANNIEPEKQESEHSNNNDASYNTAPDVLDATDNLSQSPTQPITVTSQTSTDESSNTTIDQNTLNVSTSMPASQSEPIKINSPRAANSLPSSLTKEAELPSSVSSMNSSPSPSPSSGGIQAPKEQVTSSSPDSTDSSDKMTNSVSSEPSSDNPLVTHKPRTKKGRKPRVPVIAPLVTPVVFDSPTESSTPKSAPSPALSNKDTSPAIPKKDTTPPLSHSQPSTPGIPRTASTTTGTKSSFNNFLNSILPAPNQPGTNPPQSTSTPSSGAIDKPQAKDKVQQVFNNFLDTIIPAAPSTQQATNVPLNAVPAVQQPKEDDIKSSTIERDAAAQYPAAAVSFSEKKDTEKKDKFNLQKFTDQLRDKVKEEILPEAAKGLDEIKKFFKTGTLKKTDDKDKTSSETVAPKAIEIEDVKTRFVAEKVNALRRTPTNLILPSKSTTLSSSITTSVTRTEYLSGNEQRRTAVLMPLLKQWLKYFDNELRLSIDLTSTNDKLFMKQEDNPLENNAESGTTSIVATPLELRFVSKKSIEMLLTACYKYKAFNDTSTVNERDLMDNFIENYWGLFNYNEVYLYTWQSNAQPVLTKLDSRGEEYFAQALAAYESKVAEQHVGDDLAVDSLIREAQLRKQIQLKIKDEGINDTLQQIDVHKQWSLWLRNSDLLLGKNPSATIQFLVNRSDELLPSLILETIDDKNKLQYVQKLLKERHDLRRDARLVHVLLKELIAENPPDRTQIFNADHKFRTDALKIEWSNGYYIMKILNRPNKYQFDAKYAEDLTREHGFIKGLKLMLLNNRKYEVLISLIVELDDIEEFERVLHKNPITSTPASWTHLIRAVLAYCNPKVIAPISTPARRINILFVAHRAIDALGPRTAINVLQTCLKDQQTHLPASFFSAVLAETRAEVWAKLPIMRESLEVLDSHLWSVRSSALGAPFAEVFNHEIDSQVNDLNVDLPFVAIGANVLKMYLDFTQTNYDLIVQGLDEPNFEYIEHSPAYFEEANVHWGVSTNLTTHM